MDFTFTDAFKEEQLKVWMSRLSEQLQDGGFDIAFALIQPSALIDVNHVLDLPVLDHSIVLNKENGNYLASTTIGFVLSGEDLGSIELVREYPSDIWVALMDRLEFLTVQEIRFALEGENSPAILVNKYLTVMYENFVIE